MTTTGSEERPAVDGGVGATADERERAALEPVLARLAGLLEPDQFEPGTAFAQAAFRRSSPERLAELEPEQTAAMLANAFRLMDARAPGELALRVYNPTVAEHGWSSPRSVVEVNLEDGPFLLSTTTEELDRLGTSVVDTIHPIMGVARAADGGVESIVPARHAASRESWMLLELGDRLPPDRLEEVEEGLRRVLADAQAAMRDFPAMRDAMEDVAYRVRASAGSAYSLEEVDEAIALLDWLRDDHFILLGYREYELVDSAEGPAARVTPGSGLGILRDEDASSWAEPVPLSQVSPGLRARMEGGNLLIVSRTNRVSTVHRQQRMLYVGVKKVDDEGAIVGEFRMLGLFAQRAYAEPASSIPTLRRKLRQILDLEDVVDHSYDERALRALFEALPKDELFQADVEDLRHTLVELLQVAKRQEVRLFLSLAPGGRALSALVAVPRERFNAALRAKVQQLLVDHFGAAGVDYHLSLTERGQALLSFMLHVGRDEDIAVPDDSVREALERKIGAYTRTWADTLTDELVRVHGEREGRHLAQAWTERFPAGYTDVTSVETAIDDLRELEALAGDGDVRIRMRLSGGRVAHRVILYKAGAGVELSSFLPILESLGLVVVEELPHRLTGREHHIHDFGVRLERPLPGERQLDPATDGPRLAAAALAMWHGRAETDSLNRLVLSAGLSWDEVAILRAYRRYRRQVGTSFTEAYQNEALVEHPAVTRALVDLFDAKFNPQRAADDEEIATARQAVIDAAEEIDRLDQDRIVRGFLGLVDATLRTNRYLEDRGHLSLKLASSRVPDIPKPVPYVEIFVYSPLVEGIHLRGGPVARGGIRWSDRQEDFRTEILGLMKAQMVKNAVIVPTGSKGGFVLKRPPADPAALREAVREQYAVYIRGLLDLTDNVVADEGAASGEGLVQPPAGVRRHDGDDPYLVVAADRGTATFSDLANSISEEYGFWLGDAFASGGSRGYDHKAMGITARGAWVAVQRHFRELDVDVQTEPITVVGIGDMSGDVFGNGLLRSRAVKLVAAFDHRDIFIDPDPDPEASFDERARLFALPSSSWQDYDRSVISQGGGVWSRTVKEIALSDEARRALRISESRISPPELIRAILKAPADLLFAGGIGTFVKASTESHADVGDRANDGIRVDANEVGARVIGEGGNLAVTQQGRIQYAKRGGRINTDAVDNSAGVDTSDHEVNLKILLGMAAAAGELTVAERDELLEAMTEDVADAVLRDVYLQTGAISQELSASSGGLERYESLMQRLEAAGRLDRGVEGLPPSTEIARRRKAGAGLTRPELAVLLGYAKVDLAGEVLASALPDAGYLAATLESYFPEAAVQRLGHLIPAHRLRRELVATTVANDLVNRMGITWASRTAEEFGAGLPAVASAYWIARSVSGADLHWRAIEALDAHATPALQMELKGEVDRLVDAFARAYLRQDPAVDLGKVIARDRPAFEELTKAVAERPPPTGSTWERKVAHYADLGIDPDLAELVVGLTQLTFVPDVSATARESGHPVAHVAKVFMGLSDRLPLDRLHSRLVRIEPSGFWERWQHRGLIDDLRSLRRSAAREALREEPDHEPDQVVDAFVDRRRRGLQRARDLVDRLERDSEAGVEAVAVAVRLLREATLL